MEGDDWYMEMWHAPKDGTRILLYGPVGNDTKIQVTAAWEALREGKTGWRVASSKDNVTLWFPSPTHWRPLPPDPVQEGE